MWLGSGNPGLSSQLPLGSRTLSLFLSHPIISYSFCEMGVKLPTVLCCKIKVLTNKAQRKERKSIGS